MADRPQGRARAVIERARSEGRYERLSETEEELEARQEEPARVRHEAEAVRLLRQVVGERRQETVSGQLPGLEEAITRTLRHITGRERPVRIGSDLQVEGIAIETDVTPHEVKHLSAGTREQLDLVARIALGKTYAKHYGGTMMVLHDGLLYTDPMRQDRAKEILRRAGELLQVFILTLQLDRYQGIVPADQQADLQALLAGRAP